MKKLFRKRPKVAISYSIICTDTNNETELLKNAKYDFHSDQEASVFLKHLFESDMAAVSYFENKDEFHYLSTSFDYGLGYKIEFDNITMSAIIINISKKKEKFIRKSSVDLLKYLSKHRKDNYY